MLNASSLKTSSMGIEVIPSQGLAAVTAGELGSGLPLDQRQMM
jgi:hypothetical protein